jgi:hypothetical protein
MDRLMDSYCERIRISFFVAYMDSHVVRNSVADVEANKTLESVALSVAAVKLSFVAFLEPLPVSEKSIVIVAADDAVGCGAAEAAIRPLLYRCIDRCSVGAWLLPTVGCDRDQREPFGSGPCGMPSANLVLCEPATSAALPFSPAQ